MSDPWGDFLTARAKAIDWLATRESDEQIARTLSMDPVQVHLIRTRDRSTDQPDDDYEEFEPPRPGESLTIDIPLIDISADKSSATLPLTHPVDILKDLAGDALTPDGEAMLRAVCDEQVHLCCCNDVANMEVCQCCGDTCYCTSEYCRTNTKATAPRFKHGQPDDE